MVKNFSVLFSICILLIVQRGNAQTKNETKGWLAGVARVIITPQESIWLAGYASRTHPAEGKLQDLWAKALALQDENGKRCLLITLDLLGIPKYISDRIRNELKLKYKLDRAQIIINSSHTHSGPVVSDYLSNAYELNDEQIKKIKTYTEKLIKQIIQLGGDALNTLKQANVFTGNGLARFQVNRRNNNEAFLLLQSELKGPNDYDVPVIKITDKSNSIMAIAFGYACHNTVLNGYQWSGDYAGFAQLELEKMYPGATAMFFQGAGADQNPLPRRTVPLAMQYGKELAFAVENVLDDSMEKQAPHLTYSYTEVQLPLNPPPSKNELELMIKDTTDVYKRRSALSLLSQINKGIPVRKSYPYPIQAWKLGDQPLFALGGELVVHYSIEIKRMYGPKAFVLGYCNDVMAYIPTVQIIKESNDKTSGYAFYDPTNHNSVSYEGGIFTQLVYGLPGTWASNVETFILNGVQQVAKKANLTLANYQ